MSRFRFLPFLSFFRVWVLLISESGTVWTLRGCGAGIALKEGRSCPTCFFLGSSCGTHRNSQTGPGCPAHRQALRKIIKQPRRRFAQPETWLQYQEFNGITFVFASGLLSPNILEGNPCPYFLSEQTSSFFFFLFIRIATCPDYTDTCDSFYRRDIRFFFDVCCLFVNFVVNVSMSIRRSPSKEMGFCSMRR